MATLKNSSKPSRAANTLVRNSQERLSGSIFGDEVEKLSKSPSKAGMKGFKVRAGLKRNENNTYTTS